MRRAQGQFWWRFGGGLEGLGGPPESDEVQDSYGIPLESIAVLDRRCFVGISFYRTLDEARLLTSVAHVFNERGEGVLVKGAQAQLHRDDKTPHLSEDDARKLPRQADSSKGDCPLDEGLGRNVSGGTRPRLSWGRSLL